MTILNYDAVSRGFLNGLLAKQADIYSSAPT